MPLYYIDPKLPGRSYRRDESFELLTQTERGRMLFAEALRRTMFDAASVPVKHNHTTMIHHRHKWDALEFIYSDQRKSDRDWMLAHTGATQEMMIEFVKTYDPESHRKASAKYSCERILRDARGVAKQ